MENLAVEMKNDECHKTLYRLKENLKKSPINTNQMYRK